MKVKITIFDLETTSENPVQAEILTGYFHTIIFDLKEQTYEFVDEFSVRAKPDKYLFEAFGIHGITKDEAANFPAKRDALREICKFAKKHSDGFFLCHAASGFYGHDGYYDWLVIMNQLMQLSNEAYLWAQINLRVRVISTHTIAKKLLKQRSNGLKELSIQFNLGHFEHHNEVKDVMQTLKLFIRLIDGMTYLSSEDLYDLGHYSGEKSWQPGLRLI